MRLAAAFLACVLIWGSTWYAIEWQVGVVPLLWSVTFRFGIATAIIALWCLAKKEKMRLSRKEHLVTASIGLFLFSANYIAAYQGINYLSSGLVAIAFSLLSFLNILSARLFLKTPVNPSLLGSACIGITGLALIFFPEIQDISPSDSTTYGLMFCILSTVFASLGNTIAASGKAYNISLLPLNFWGMTYGTLINASLALALGEPFILDPRPEYWAALLYLSLFGSVLAFTLYIWLVTRTGVGQAAYVMVLTPLVALAISTLYEGFIWTSYSITGLFMVIAGNILMLRRPPRPRD